MPGAPSSRWEKSGISEASARSSPIHTHTSECRVSTAYDAMWSAGVIRPVPWGFETHVPRVVAEPVVRALDVLTAEAALAEWREAVCALVDDRAGSAVELAIEHHRLLADGARHELTRRKVVRPHRHIPPVAQVLHASSVRGSAAGREPSVPPWRTAPTRDGRSRPTAGTC